MKKKSLREDMPCVTAFIDSLRAAFGKEAVDGQIRDGMRGQPVFWARENGIEIGTRSNPDVPFESYFNAKNEEGSK